MTTANLTIVDNETVVQYTSVGETVFAYPFPILAAAELKVSVDQVLQTLGVDYTLDGIGDANGGNVTFTSATSAGEKVTLWLDLPIARLTGFALGASTLLPQALNTEFVRQVRVDQMLRRDLGRTLRLAVDDPESGQNMQIPTQTARIGKFLAFDSLGRPIVSTGTSGADDALRTDLASAVAGIDGARLVGYRRLEAGAVGRTVSERLMDRAALLDFGAVGDNDGSVGDGTDDTAAVAAAVAALPGYQLDLAGLNYRVSSVLPASPVPAGAHFVNGEVVSDQMVTTQDEYSVTVFGRGALMHNTYIPEQHAASGGRFFASGNHLVAIGREAMKANTTGRRNTAVGSRSMLGNTTGYYNTCIGSHTFEVGTTGFENTCVGVQSLQRAVNAEGNSMLGLGAGLGITSGSYNTGMGWGALGGVNGGVDVTTGNYNCALGYRALYGITNATGNVAIGRDAAISITQGNDNTVVGSLALNQAVDGGSNTAIGSEALRNTTGSQHTAVGAQALLTITSGLGGTAVGYQAGRLVTGNYLTAMGYQAGAAVSTGSNNTVFGRASGAAITTGSGNTCIGYSADVSAGAAVNQNAFGNGATCSGDNQVTLGNGSIALLRCQVTTITAISDRRDKKNIEDLPLGLEFINGVKVRRFKWDSRDGRKTDTFEAGIIAQELAELQEKHGAQWMGLVFDANPEKLEATPGKLLFPLIRAVQELSQRLSKLEAA